MAVPYTADATDHCVKVQMSRIMRLNRMKNGLLYLLATQDKMDSPTTPGTIRSTITCHRKTIVTINQLLQQRTYNVEDIGVMMSIVLFVQHRTLFEREAYLPHQSKTKTCHDALGKLKLATCLDGSLFTVQGTK